MARQTKTDQGGGALSARLGSPGYSGSQTEDLERISLIGVVEIPFLTSKERLASPDLHPICDISDCQGV